MAADVVVDQIAAAVAAREPINGIRVVGIDGPSGSGKSHLARGLAEIMRAPIIEIDDFVSWDDFAGWWPRFDAQVLAPLLNGQDAVFQARDWTDWYGARLGEWKTQRWSPTVVFEGVTCTRRATVGRLSYAVWVEAPAPLRLARGLARDGSRVGAERLWQKWMAEEERFFAADGTRERADLVLDTARHGAP
jgi:energy-coupling factor transporter ATP-binding protein EcfA2